MDEETVAGINQLCESAAWLVEQASGPLKKLRLRSGDLTVELEWPTARPASESVGHPVYAETAELFSHQLGITADSPQQPVLALDDGSFIVHAPLVGTFYRGPSPDAAPFVAEGQQIAAGQQLAIVEAMKLMNAIEIDRPGIVVDVLVADGSSVEYGDALFVIASL